MSGTEIAYGRDHVRKIAVYKRRLAVQVSDMGLCDMGLCDMGLRYAVSGTVIAYGHAMRRTAIAYGRRVLYDARARRTTVSYPPTRAYVMPGTDPRTTCSRSRVTFEEVTITWWQTCTTRSGTRS
eukprot:1282943-Rhodomonas_salina.3